VLLRDCPKDLQPDWYGSKCQYLWPNGSQIQFAGSNSQSFDNLRGQQFHRFDIDEGAYHDDLVELVEGVANYAVMDSNGLIRIASSAPTVADHPFDTYWAEAKAGGYGAEFDIDSAGYPPELVERYIAEAGGRSKPRVQRELFCKTVIDSDIKLVSEWDSNKYVREVPRDEFFQFYKKYSGLDTAVNDATSLLAGYYHFPTATLIIEDEAWLIDDAATVQGVVAAGKRLEKDLGYVKMYRRVADCAEKFTIQSISQEGLPTISCQKESLQAMISTLKLWIGSGRVLVNPKCKYLIGCLEAGIWNHDHTAFGHSKTYKHFDAIAALMYLIRHIDITDNPIPANFGTSIYTHVNLAPANQSKNAKNLRELVPNVNVSIHGIEKKDETENILSHPYFFPGGFGGIQR